MQLSDVNRVIGLHTEGTQQAKEALGVYEWLGDTVDQAQCLIYLAWPLRSENQLDAAEEAASRAIDLLPERGQQFRVNESHRVLGNIRQSKGDTEKAIHHLEVALGIASPFDWHDTLFWIDYELTVLFRDEDKFDDAHAHTERAKLHIFDNAYRPGHVMELQARVRHRQHRVEQARSEALRAADVYEKIVAAKNVKDCRSLLRYIEKGLDSPVASGQPDLDCERLLLTALLPARIDSPFQAQGTKR